MSIINLFGKRPQPQKFGFKPRYYDEGREDLEIRLSKYAHDDNPDMMKERIRYGFRRKGVNSVDYASSSRSSNKRLVVIIMALGLAAVVLMRSQSFLKWIEKTTPQTERKNTNQISDDQAKPVQLEELK